MKLCFITFSTFNINFSKFEMGKMILQVFKFGQ